MKKYLICSLDDESYYHPMYTFCSSLEDAKKICTENVSDDPEASAEFKPYEEGTYRCDIRIGEDGFEVNHILPVHTSEGKYYLIYHHAYDGVDFCKVYQSDSFEDVQNELKKQSSDLCHEYSGFDYFCNTYEAGFDDGNEWHYYRIVED